MVLLFSFSRAASRHFWGCFLAGLWPQTCSGCHVRFERNIGTLLKIIENCWHQQLPLQSHIKKWSLVSSSSRQVHNGEKHHPILNMKKTSNWTFFSHPLMKFLFSNCAFIFHHTCKSIIMASNTYYSTEQIKKKLFGGSWRRRFE